MVSNISVEDIINVAKSINISLTEDEINGVLQMYNHEEDCDPSATWDLIIENCIYQLIRN